MKKTYAVRYQNGSYHTYYECEGIETAKRVFETVKEKCLKSIAFHEVEVIKDKKTHFEAKDYNYCNDRTVEIKIMPWTGSVEFAANEAAWANYRIHKFFGLI